MQQSKNVDCVLQNPQLSARVRAEAKQTGSVPKLSARVWGQANGTGEVSKLSGRVSAQAKRIALASPPTGAYFSQEDIVGGKSLQSPFYGRGPHPQYAYG